MMDAICNLSIYETKTSNRERNQNTFKENNISKLYHMIFRINL